VYLANDGTFRIVTGTIYGSNEANAALRNKVDIGAALYKDSSSTVQYGTFNGTDMNRFACSRPRRRLRFH
jgi:hypothetical protein